MQPLLIRSPLPVPTTWQVLCRHFAHMWTQGDRKGFVANFDLFHTSGTRKTEDVIESCFSTLEPRGEQICNVVPTPPTNVLHVPKHRFS